MTWPSRKALDHPGTRYPAAVFVAGVDGCRSGWVVALRGLRTLTFSVQVVPTFAAVVSLPESPVVIAVDMPIGLLDAAVRGGRSCDRQARALLGTPRCSAIFTPPARAALRATTYAEACAANRAASPMGTGISIQTFGIFDKLREVDQLMTPALQARVREVHPELSFHAMACHPARHAKKTAAGWASRPKTLVTCGWRWR